MSCDLVVDAPSSSVASVLTDVLLIPESRELLSDVTDVGGACVEPRTLAFDWLVKLNQSSPVLSPWERTDSPGRRAGRLWGRSQAPLPPGGAVSPADA